MESTGGAASRGKGGARGGRHGGGGREVQVSKALSWLLRHGAVEMGLSIRADGYVPLSEVLEVPTIKSRL
jgi:2'-phosphotransferase